VNPPLLHSYFRSSAAWRVRIALNLKGVAHAIRPVHLVKDGGEHHSEAYRAINPQGRVPALEIDGEILTQSPAILEWIEETWPEPPLLPAAPFARAHVRAIVSTICCDIAPLQNSGTQKWLRQEGGLDDTKIEAWLTHWIGSGLAAIEALMARRGETGRFIGGDEPGLAECCLIPQLFGARRFNVPLEAYPRLLAAEAACASLPAFVEAAPGSQPDAE
jgi:maleylacetoacetate isomerase